ncbi:MAG: carbon-nitrogen hydrolase family protein [Deltaproteobacteria bacterium]|nr:carbon-nitrogen hydrolase family protein [Deltaproteobacteria bacterium]
MSEKNTYEDAINVAAVNFHALPGDKEANLKKIEDFMDRSADKGVDLIVFPEVALTGYGLSPEQALDIAEEIPGPSTERIMDIAAKCQLHIVFGMPEKGGSDKIYNTAPFITPDGILGRYRKVHIPPIEPWASPGDEYPVFDTKFGPIAIGICWEEYCFPEVPRIYALKGARLLINITATPDFGNMEDTRESTLGQLKARVHENGYFIVSADLVGPEGDTTFVGYSAILGPKPDLMMPQVYAGPASSTEDEMLFATLDLSFATRKPPGLAHIFENRQPHTYSPLVSG